MEDKSSVGGTYQFVIKRIDQRLVLMVPTNHGKQVQEMLVGDRGLPERLEGLKLNDVFNCESRLIYGTPTKFGIIQEKNENYGGESVKVCRLPLEKTEECQFFEDKRRQQLKKQSIIQELQPLANQKFGQSFCQNKTSKLQSLQCVETRSFSDGESYNFDDEQSEIMDLTPEQENFFHQFITPDICNSQIEDSFSKVQLKNHQSQSPKVEYHIIQSQPKNKIKVIRNFFRPKGSLIKDDKTCCNSEMFLQEISQRTKGTQRSFESFGEEEGGEIKTSRC